MNNYCKKHFWANTVKNDLNGLLTYITKYIFLYIFL